MSKRYNWKVITGAAFLMATSAIGPGFVTQTAVFTQQLGASFGFVILMSVILDAVAQLNIWRTIAASGKPAQSLANSIFPGLGSFISILVFLGGLAFNIGNIAGAGLGLNVLFGIPVMQGAILSAIIAIAIFLYKEAGKAMDLFSKLLGLLMIGLTLYIAISSQPPMAEAALRSIAPSKFSFAVLLTIVGGTVGGYITFAGAHRLLDAGISGTQNLPSVNRSALSAIGIASLMRLLIFIGALGVIAAGHTLDPENPPASVFKLAAGEVGYKIFGLVMWAASITSVIGAAYTSVSFINTFHHSIKSNNQRVITLFIIISLLFFVTIGNPIRTLIVVGAINGLILPVALGTILIAANKKKIVGSYRQPVLLTLLGVAVVIVMIWMGGETIYQIFLK